jgi:glycosyltransferase involved in cell wall biosynthesis
MNILILGVGPLPEEATDILCAPGLRLELFATTLSNAGHNITVGREHFRSVTSGREAPDHASRSFSSKHGFEICDLEFSDTEGLRDLVKSKETDAVIACTDVMANLAARANLGVPLWIDYFGDPMNERQLQGWRAGNDEALLDGYQKMLSALLGADRFSVCCPLHRAAIVGQLGLVGRLNRHIAGQQLVHLVRPAWSFQFPEPSAGLQAPPIPEKKKDLPENAVVLLWSGGYNNWADIDSLFTALEKVFEQNPLVHFLSTGGQIKGQSNSVFDAFYSRVEESKHRDHYHFLGWIDTCWIPTVYRAADIGINLDVFTYEGELGTRNRLLDWAKFGMASVTTPLCELAEEMIHSSAALEAPYESPDDVARQLLTLIESPEQLNQMKKSAIRFAEEWVTKAVSPELLEWADDPQPAPDLPAPGERTALAFTRPDNSLAERFELGELQRGIDQLMEDRGSSLYTLYRKLKRRK